MDTFALQEISFQFNVPEVRPFRGEGGGGGRIWSVVKNAPQTMQLPLGVGQGPSR